MVILGLRVHANVMIAGGTWNASRDITQTFDRTGIDVIGKITEAL